MVREWISVILLLVIFLKGIVEEVHSVLSIRIFLTILFRIMKNGTVKRDKKLLIKEIHYIHDGLLCRHYKPRFQRPFN